MKFCLIAENNAAEKGFIYLLVIGSPDVLYNLDISVLLYEL